MEHAQNAENIMTLKMVNVFQQERTPNVDYGTRVKPSVIAVTIRIFSTWTIMESVQERINTAMI